MVEAGEFDELKYYVAHMCDSGYGYHYILWMANTKSYTWSRSIYDAAAFTMEEAIRLMREYPVNRLDRYIIKPAKSEEILTKEMRKVLNIA